MRGAHHGWVQSGIGDVRRRILLSLLLSRLTEPILQERVSEVVSKAYMEFALTPTGDYRFSRFKFNMAKWYLYE
jgi:hypothetical protein